MFLAEKTLDSLMSPERVRRFLAWYVCQTQRCCFQLQAQYRDNPHDVRVPPHVVYAHLKFLWANGQHDESLTYLFKFTDSMADDLTPEQERASSSVNKAKIEDLSRLLARCYFKQGQWQVAHHHDWDTVCTMLLCA